MFQFPTITVVYEARKIESVEDAVREAATYARETDARVYEVVGTMTFEPKQYEQLSVDCLLDDDVWTAATALEEVRAPKTRSGYHAVEIACTDGRRFYVDTQGYDYARYVLVTADQLSF